MFKLVTKLLPWRGAEVKARLVNEKKAGVRRLAHYVRDQAELYAPYDASKPAGELHLRDTIQVIEEAGGERFHVIASAPWAEPVEFGHRMRNGAYYPPNPFMRRALQDGARAMPQFLGDARVRQGYHAGRLMGATFE